MDPSSSTTLMSSTAAVAAASTTPVAARNAIASLADDMLSVAVALLNLVTTLVTFSTITVPSTVYAILHYSLTLQLNFPSLALLFIAALIAAFVWLRYRHLNRYERLREVPLTKDEGFNLHPDVAAAGDDADRGNFHNYLDEFLQAIRIFGFLEKPVSNLSVGHSEDLGPASCTWTGKFWREQRVERVAR